MDLRECEGSRAASLYIVISACICSFNPCVSVSMSIFHMQSLRKERRKYKNHKNEM